ncbi:MAG: hypothetical protein R3C18_08825 [Planctomycetaceae bacterium]
MKALQTFCGMVTLILPILLTGTEQTIPLQLLYVVGGWLVTIFASEMMIKVAKSNDPSASPLLPRVLGGGVAGVILALGFWCLWHLDKDPLFLLVLVMPIGFINGGVNAAALYEQTGGDAIHRPPARPRESPSPNSVPPAVNDALQNVLDTLEEIAERPVEGDTSTEQLDPLEAPANTEENLVSEFAFMDNRQERLQGLIDRSRRTQENRETTLRLIKTGALLAIAGMLILGGIGVLLEKNVLPFAIASTWFFRGAFFCMISAVVLASSKLFIE